MIRKLPQLSLLIFLALALSACASKQPTMADEMREAAAGVQAEADRQAALAEDWERGQALIASGERKISRGERRVSDAERALSRGRDEIAEGRRELDEGRRLVERSERAFREIQQAPEPPQ
ncbi:MAG: hypothetical protein ACXIUB_01995 [Wenzhouxiangella sp.]